jgi:putative transposase
MSTPDRRGMLDCADKAPSIRRQCILLGIAATAGQRQRLCPDAADDELFTAWPFLGSRQMTAMLKADGLQVNRKRVQRLMRAMGIAALGPKPNTTKPAPGHKIYPHLLRNMTIDRPNEVWAAHITYRAPRPTVGEAYDWNVKRKED